MGCKVLAYDLYLSDEAIAMGVEYVDIEPVVAPRLSTCNPDGMHWSWEVHSLVGEAVASVLSQ